MYATDLQKTQEVVGNVLTSVPGGRHCVETRASQIDFVRLYRLEQVEIATSFVLLQAEKVS